MNEEPYKNRGLFFRENLSRLFVVKNRRITSQLPAFPSLFSGLRDSIFSNIREFNTHAAIRHLQSGLLRIDAAGQCKRYLATLFWRPIIFTVARCTQLPKVLSNLLIRKSMYQRPLHTKAN